jgi:hypothetical protein
MHAWCVHVSKPVGSTNAYILALHWQNVNCAVRRPWQLLPAFLVLPQEPQTNCHKALCHAEMAGKAHQDGVKDLVVLPWVCQELKQQVWWYLVPGLKIDCSSCSISLQESQKQHMREL